MLAAWASGRRRATGPVRGGLRFAFYGRVSTEDWQDPVTSRARQREQAEALVRGHGVIVAEFFDAGESRTVAWGRRPQAAALVALLADPDRGWDAIVVGEYERAFYGSQYAAMAPLFEHYGVQLWMPEAGGRVDFASEHDEQAMTVLGLSSKREVTRTSIRVRTAMAVQVREQGRYLGGRPPYGYRLGDAGPHPNKAHAAWGRRAHRLEPDPETAHVVRWVFAQRLAGHSVARIARTLNDAGDAVPVGVRPGQPAPRGAGWTLGTVTTILSESAVHLAVCGVEPARRCRPRTWPTRRTSAWGTRTCSGGTCPTAGSSPHDRHMRRWSARPTSSPPRTSMPPAARPRADLTGPGKREYLLSGLLVCGMCGRRMESAWSNGKPAYRCRHGHTTASAPDPARPRNAYVREDRVLPHLPALHLLLTGPAKPQERADGGAREEEPTPGPLPARRRRSGICARTRSSLPTTRPPETC